MGHIAPQESSGEPAAVRVGENSNSWVAEQEFPGPTQAILP